MLKLSVNLAPLLQITLSILQKPGKSNFSGFKQITLFSTLLYYDFKGKRFINY